jgi:hypothetical protein
MRKFGDEKLERLTLNEISLVNGRISVFQKILSP